MMGQSTEREVRLKIAGLVPGGLTSADEIIEAIREVLDDNPSAIEEIVPGKKLQTRPLTSEEKARVAGQRSAEKRQRKTEQRYQQVVPVLKEIVEARPDFSLREIAKELDRRGLKPERSANWSSGTVRWMMVRAGLIDSDDH